MMRKINNKKNNQGGFTLIELMIVVIIIGILVAIAIPVYTSTQKDAEKTVCDANIRMIRSAIVQAQFEGKSLNVGEDGNVELSQLSAYFDTLPDCPSEGEYTITYTNGKYKVECSEHGEGDDGE